MSPTVTCRVPSLICIAALLLPACTAGPVSVPATAVGQAVPAPFPSGAGPAPSPPGSLQAPVTADNGNPFQEVEATIVLPYGVFERLRSAAGVRTMSVAWRFQATAYSAAAAQSAAEYIGFLGTNSGIDASQDLALSGAMTRAELVTLIVRAFDQQTMAAQLKGLPTFPDTANHWASGYITVAKAMLEAMGSALYMSAIYTPDGLFHPDRELTTAEALDLIVRYAGGHIPGHLPQLDGIFHTAIALALIAETEAELLMPQAEQPLNRNVGYLLVERCIANYAKTRGRAFYDSHVTVAPPTLTVSEYPAETTAETMQLSGSVSGFQTRQVSVAGRIATTDASGHWMIDVPLQLGTNDILVSATNGLGISTSKQVRILRVAAASPSPSEPLLPAASPAPTENAPPVKAPSLIGNPAPNEPFDQDQIELAQVLARLKVELVVPSGSGTAVTPSVPILKRVGRAASGETYMTVGLLMDRTTLAPASSSAPTVPLLRVKDTQGRLMLAGPVVTTTGTTKVDALSTGVVMLADKIRRTGGIPDAQMISPQALIAVADQVSNALLSSNPQPLPESPALQRLVDAVSAAVAAGTPVTPAALAIVKQQAGVGGGGGNGGGDESIPVCPTCP